MPIIKIDKNVFQEIENVIERRDKMYEEQMATAKKLTDGIEKLYQQKVKSLEKENQQLHSIIKEVREYIDSIEYVRYGIIEVDEMKIRKILDKVDKE